jgi:hypothetical protein
MFKFNEEPKTRNKRQNIYLEGEIDREAANSNHTAIAVVLAANGLGIAEANK